MAKRKLVSIAIRPSKNGGHHVRHDYEPKPQMRGGGMNRSLTMGDDSEEHTFGPGDHNALVKHIAGALGLKGLGQEPENGG